MKKYKELPTFTKNEFKIGDKAYCYDSATTSHKIHTIRVVDGDYVHLEELEPEWKGMGIHFLCCRKLEEAKPREYWIMPRGLSFEKKDEIYGVDLVSEKKLDDNEMREQGYILVREVLEEEE